MIPKIVYQTWKTQRLPLVSQYALHRMKKMNPSYSFRLFDDSEIVNFIESNFDESVRVAYSRLRLGASKADLFRYCVLFINGGVYVDIDSEIVGNLDDLLGNSSACITRELNHGRFVQWMLAFEPGHPILERVIFYVVSEILSRPVDDTMDYDIVKLTGPDVFSRGVVDAVGLPNLWYKDDISVAHHLQHAEHEQVRRSKLYTYDYGEFALFKFPYNHFIDVEKFVLHGTFNWKHHEWMHHNFGLVNRAVSVVAVGLCIIILIHLS